jgi:iron complex outermembrane recepter protein
MKNNLPIQKQFCHTRTKGVQNIPQGLTIMHGSPRVSRSLLLGLTTALAVAATIAQADEAAAPQNQPDASALQEVVVTAQKRQEKLHDVPMGVTAITSSELDKQRLVDFSDLQAKVPALSVEMVQPGQDRLTLRGENVGSVGSTVTTYIDDTPFGSSNALANGSIVTGDFDTWDLQRVEVLRGPQGTLYGAGSEGGLLKYVTNPPDPTREEGAFQVGGEDVSHGGQGPSVKGMLNMPIGSSAAFRVSGFDTWLPGYINDPSLGETEINHGYREGLRASLLIDASDNFSMRFSAFGQNLHTDGTPYVDVVGAAGNPLAPPADQLSPLIGDYNQQRFINEASDFRYRIYSATLNWNLGWGTATSITSYGRSVQDLVEDATSLQLAPGLPLGAFVQAKITGVPTGSYETSGLNVGKFTEELRLASSSAQALEWQIGAYYTRESSDLDQVLPTFFIPSQASTGLPSLENATLDALYREWSGFGQFTYHFNQAFDLALGGRWSENKQAEDETTSGLLIGPVSVTSAASTGTDFTYSIAPRWHVNDATMVYARVASGYRPGGPNALPPVTPVGVVREYQSDSSVNYELGTRTSLLDNRLSIDLAAFLINWKKIQLFQYVDNFGINANGGTATSKGAEWTIALTPIQGLTFTLTGAYVDAYLTADAPAAGGLNGDPLPYAPKFSGSLDAVYDWAAWGDYRGFAGATFSYIGSRTADFMASTTIVNNMLVGLPDPRAGLPSYNTVNLRAGFDNARWTFELYVKNLFDSRGITYYTNSDAPNLGGDIGLTLPRTAGAAVTMHF